MSKTAEQKKVINPDDLYAFQFIQASTGLRTSVFTITPRDLAYDLAHKDALNADDVYVMFLFDVDDKPTPENADDFFMTTPVFRGKTFVANFGTPEDIAVMFPNLEEDSTNEPS